MHKGFFFNHNKCVGCGACSCPAFSSACPTESLEFGKLFDRIIYYIDFNLLNINKLIKDHINAARNEKKRG